MAVTLAVGTQVQIASTYGASKTMSQVSNANPAVATLEATHGVVVGDYIEITTSGWSLLAGRVVRVSAVSTNDVTLEGVDCSDTTKFPGGVTGAAGTVKEITAWTQLSQLTGGISSSGGEQQYADISTLDDRTQRQIPTTRSPVALELPGYFDQSLAWVVTVRAASEAASAKAVRLVYPNNSRTVGNAYWSMADIPSIEDNTLRSKISLTFAAQPITYAT